MEKFKIIKFRSMVENAEEILLANKELHQNILTIATNCLLTKIHA